MKRKVDKTKKKNIYCAHCEYYSGWISEKCKLNGEHKNYWNRCKNFKWARAYDEQAD